MNSRARVGRGNILNDRCKKRVHNFKFYLPLCENKSDCKAKIDNRIVAAEYWRRLFLGGVWLEILHYTLTFYRHGAYVRLCVRSVVLITQLAAHYVSAAYSEIFLRTEMRINKRGCKTIARVARARPLI